MITFFQFAQPYWLIYAAFFVVVASLVRWRWHRPTLYRYSLLHLIKKENLQASSFVSNFFYILRILIFAVLLLLLGKPQWVDKKSKINVEGIDIILALDMSGSMCLMDDLDDRRSRLQVAKQEALRFVQQRKNDAIGLVLFGRYAIARCPLTLDKPMLNFIISDLELGKPSQDMQNATVLSQGLATAARRLQNSKSASKIVILLTDGTPSPDDINPADAIAIAQDLGVKVYTIGIGGDAGGFTYDAIFGLQRTATPVNKELLRKIAQETGGQFFEAQKPKDLARIYQIIDNLEKQTYQTELYSKYHDFFIPLLWLTISLLLLELFVSVFVWFVL